MNKIEHLLCCLAEEANEVAHRVSKALRFGLEEIQDGQTLTNAQRISQEFNDMLAIVEMLEEFGILGRSTDTHAIERKKNKVCAYMVYAEKCGSLDAPVRQQRDELLVAFNQAMSKVESATGCHPNAVRTLLDEALEIWGSGTASMQKGGAQ